MAAFFYMVHRYRLNGYNIVIDGNSGAIHSVDDTAYRVIGAYESGDFTGFEQGDLDEILPEIESLRSTGQLFSEDVFEGREKFFKGRQSVLKAICLHLAHSCNMDCAYCFAGKGEYKGDEGLMSYDVAKKAIDFLVDNSGTRRNLEVDFFGGEPLLNYGVLTEVVRYARGLEEKHNKKFSFTLTTNGLLLNDDIIDFANREMSNVVLSLDGRKSVNDRVRNTKSGGGTYDLVLDKFKKLVDGRKNKDYYIRGTYTRYNLDFSKDVLHMADLGFKEISVEPVVCAPGVDYGIEDCHIDEICNQYEILAMEMMDREKRNNGFNFFHYDIDFEAGPCISKRISGCGVGTEYVAITPEGNIFPCHRFVEDAGHKLGNLDEGIDNFKIIDSFKETNVYSKAECRDCFARLYCSGGCAANSFFDSGSINRVYDVGCRLHKKRIECAIMMKMAELEV